MNQEKRSVKLRGMKSIQGLSALKGLLCGAVATALSFAVTTESKALSFPDTAGHWAQSAISNWSDYQVMTGDDTGNFNPDDPITRGELAIMINKIMDFQIEDRTTTFTDLTQSWYITPVYKLNTAGLMYGSSGLVRPADNITRQEAAIILANAFHYDVQLLSTGELQTTYSDNSDIASWAKNSIYVLQSTGAFNAGISAGTNTFHPTVDITRAEVAYALEVMTARFVNSAEKISNGTIYGTVVVNTSGASLDTVRITGDLILAEGIFDGTISLNNVEVDGNIIVRGGSIDTIYLKDVTCNGRLEVSRKDAPTLVVVSGDSKIQSVRISYDNMIDATELSEDGYIKTVYVTEDDANVTLSGTFGNVYNESPRGNLTLYGKFDKVEMTEAGSVNETPYTAGTSVDVSTIPVSSVSEVPNINFSYSFPNTYSSASVSMSEPTLDMESGDVEFMVYVSSMEHCILNSEEDTVITVNDGSGLEITVEELDEAFGTTIFKVSFNLKKNVDSIGLTVGFKENDETPDITFAKNFESVTEDEPSASVQITSTTINDDNEVTVTVFVSNFVNCRLSAIDRRAITLEDGYTASKYPDFVVSRADNSSTDVAAYQITFVMDDDTTAMPFQLNFIDGSMDDDYADVDLILNLNLPEYDEDDDDEADKEASVTVTEETVKYATTGTLGGLEGEEVYSFVVTLTNFVDCEPYNDNYKTFELLYEDLDVEVERMDFSSRTVYYVEVAYDDDIDELEFDLNMKKIGESEEDEADVVATVADGTSDDASVSVSVGDVSILTEGTLGDLVGDKVYTFNVELTDFVNGSLYADVKDSLYFTDADFDYEVDVLVGSSRTVLQVEVAYDADIESLDFTLELDEVKQASVTVSKNLPADTSVTAVTSSLTQETGTLGALDGEDVYAFTVTLTNFNGCELPEEIKDALTQTGTTYDYEVDAVVGSSSTVLYVEVAYSEEITDLKFSLNLDEAEAPVVYNTLTFTDMFVRYWDESTNSLVDVTSGKTVVPSGATVYAHGDSDNSEGVYSTTVSVVSESDKTTSTGYTRTFVMGEEPATLTFDTLTSTASSKVTVNVTVVDEAGNNLGVDALNLNWYENDNKVSVTGENGSYSTSLGNILDIGVKDGYQLESVVKSAVFLGASSSNGSVTFTPTVDFCSVGLMGYSNPAAGSSSYRLATTVTLNVTLSGSPTGNDPDVDEETDSQITDAEDLVDVFEDLKFESGKADVTETLEAADSTLDGVTSVEVTDATLTLDAYDDDANFAGASSAEVAVTVNVEDKETVASVVDELVSDLATALVPNDYVLDDVTKAYPSEDSLYNSLSRTIDSTTKVTYYSLATYTNSNGDWFEIVIEVTITIVATPEAPEVPEASITWTADTTSHVDGAVTLKKGDVVLTSSDKFSEGDTFTLDVKDVSGYSYEVTVTGATYSTSTGLYTVNTGVSAVAVMVVYEADPVPSITWTADVTGHDDDAVTLKKDGVELTISDKFFEGDTFTLDVEDVSGYGYELKVTGATYSDSTGLYTVNTGAETVTVTVVYTENVAGTYTLTKLNNDYTISVDNEEIQSGSAVAQGTLVTITPNAIKTVASVTVEGASGEVSCTETDGVYTFNMPEEAVSVTVTYESEPEGIYTITFESMEGSNVNALETVGGVLSTLPSDPTRDGFIFEGWYLEPYCSTEVNEAHVYTGDTTLYAKWDTIYTISSVEVSVSDASELEVTEPKITDTEGKTLGTGTAISKGDTLVIKPEEVTNYNYYLLVVGATRVDEETNTYEVNGGENVTVIVQYTPVSEVEIEYEISVPEDENVSVVPTSASVNTKVVITVKEPDANEVVSVKVTATSLDWTFDATADSTEDTDTSLGYYFYMPADNVTVEVVYSKLYAVSIASKNNDDDIKLTYNNSNIVSGSYVPAGASVTVTATEKEHYTLQMNLESEEDPQLDQPANDISSYTFTMPTCGVEASVDYEAIMYTITVPEIENGTVKLSYDVANADGSTTKEVNEGGSAEIQSGTTVTVTVEPAEGYKVNVESLSGYTLLPNSNYSFVVGKEKDVEISFELVPVEASVTYKGFGVDDATNADLLKTGINLEEDDDGYFITVPLPTAWNSETTTITEIKITSENSVLSYGTKDKDSRYYVEGDYLYIYFDGAPEKEGTVELTVTVSQLTKGYVLPEIVITCETAAMVEDLGVTYVVEKNSDQSDGYYLVTVYDDKANTLGYELEFGNAFKKTNKDGDVSEFGAEITEGITTDQGDESQIKLFGGDGDCSFKISKVDEAEKVTVTLNYVLIDFELTWDGDVTVVDEDGEDIDDATVPTDVTVEFQDSSGKVLTNATVGEEITVVMQNVPTNHTPYIKVVYGGERVDYDEYNPTGKYYTFTFEMPADTTEIKVFLLEDTVNLTDNVSYSAVEKGEEGEEIEYEPLTNADGEITGAVTSAIYNKVRETLTLSFESEVVSGYVADSIVNFMIGGVEVSGVELGNAEVGVYTVTLDSYDLDSITTIDELTEITFELVYVVEDGT